MDALKDIWASLVAGVKERTTNPLTVAFIISWCLWNYRFFVVLFGDGTSAERLRTIDAMYPNTMATYTSAAFVGPAAVALIYVFIYPYISKHVIKTYRAQQVAAANMVKEVERARLITPAERDNLVHAHETEVSKLMKEIAGLESQIKALRASATAVTASSQPRIEQEQSSGPSHEGVIAPSKLLQGAVGGAAVLGDTEVRVLHELSKHASPIPLSVVSGNLKMNPTVATSILKKLKGKDYVNQTEIRDWELTGHGAEFVVGLIEAGVI